MYQPRFSQQYYIESRGSIGINKTCVFSDRARARLTQVSLISRKLSTNNFPFQLLSALTRLDGRQVHNERQTVTSQAWTWRPTTLRGPNAEESCPSASLAGDVHIHTLSRPWTTESSLH